MSEKSLLRRLIAYDRWANAQTHDSLAAVADQLPKAVTLLAHIHLGWDAWIDRIGQVERAIEWFPETGLEQCEKIGRAAQKRWDVFIAGLPDDWAEIEYTAKLLDGGVSRFTLNEIVTQLVTHGSYHRGQISTLVRGVGGEPLNTMFMRYVVTGKG